MNLLVLRPMLFLSVAMMVVTAGGWSMQARDHGLDQLVSPDFAAPSQMVRPGRLSDGRIGSFGATALPLGLPAAVVAPIPLVKVTWLGSQARQLAAIQVVAAQRSNRGPPGV